MSAGSRHGSPVATPRLLALPAEIRERVWSFVIPATDVLDVAFCPDPWGEITSRTPSSPVMQMFYRMNQRNTVVNDLGLNLLLINRQIKHESLPLLVAKTVRFCCCHCYTTFLSRLKERGIGCYWMRSVEVVVDLRDTLRLMGYLVWEIEAQSGINPSLLKTTITEALNQIKHVTHQYYGRLDTMEGAEWRVAGEIQPTCHRYVVHGKLYL